eukprot:NODE_11034_length_1312_cov_7.667511.p1 GENE.NODE_11034_length_1312_cov_7.667511~~NODE_11034_length_1312_cov_7.667511.p1  ORF type:complete len:268 (-),score=34.02 NODE_11034_length_1312_cov_7.667511:344-1147(-)
MPRKMLSFIPETEDLPVSYHFQLYIVAWNAQAFAEIVYRCRSNGQYRPKVERSSSMENLWDGEIPRASTRLRQTFKMEASRRKATTDTDAGTLRLYALTAGGTLLTCFSLRPTIGFVSTLPKVSSQAEANETIIMVVHWRSHGSEWEDHVMEQGDAQETINECRMRAAEIKHNSVAVFRRLTIGLVCCTPNEHEVEELREFAAKSSSTGFLDVNFLLVDPDLQGEDLVDGFVLAVSQLADLALAKSRWASDKSYRDGNTFHYCCAAM